MDCGKVWFRSSGDPSTLPYLGPCVFLRSQERYTTNRDREGWVRGIPPERQNKTSLEWGTRIVLRRGKETTVEVRGIPGLQNRETWRTLGLWREGRRDRGKNNRGPSAPPSLRKGSGRENTG